ncbi:MAG: Asp-tRNA(Asn)/Glu-tRNA(Gln) amidotransferase subunit GatA [Coriobacteriales bacterium]|jgi:aspartyl-tRNA(Asn)/glutamyl-tRNA(Gln) amidotransferase subunit A|nr:Asp-tRNA(Asn)/Glu-tRNA(Gln) amidotransferase subunit GatA [Coriobacteriales bacterium]
MATSQPQLQLQSQLQHQSQLQPQPQLQPPSQLQPQPQLQHQSQPQPQPKPQSQPLSPAYPQLSIADIQAGLAARSFSARELAEAALDAIAACEPGVQAFLEQTPELALAAADAVDQRLAAGEQPASIGPLAGVPMGFKDNMNLAGTHTTCASRMLEDYISPYTATCVAKSLAAGALPLGKLNMDEFAFGSSTETSAFKRTNNPWDLTRVPGGSSGGSAAAVAAGMLTVTLGSDTGGSIRQPAAFCGVVGFKPTYGVVSRYGVVAFGSSLDQVGPFGRSVADVAITLDAISGRDPLDCTSQAVTTCFSAPEVLAAGVAGTRIGYVPGFLEAEGIDAEIVTATRAALAKLEGLGAEIVEIELPNAAAALAAYYVIGPCEAFSNLSRFDSVRYGYREGGAGDLGEQYEQSRAHGFGPEAVRRIMLGSYLLSSGVYNTYYYPAQQVRTLITEDYQRAFEQVDALLSPVSPRTAFRFGEISDPASMYLSDIFTIPINIAGNGGLSLPVGLGEDSGLPVGVQIIGPQFRDENTLRVAAALESCYPDIARLAPAQGGAR